VGPPKLPDYEHVGAEVRKLDTGLVGAMGAVGREAVGQELVYQELARSLVALGALRAPASALDVS
jgi:hypothetical protein